MPVSDEHKAASESLGNALSSTYESLGITGFSDEFDNGLTMIPEHEPHEECKYRKTDRGCYYCCQYCNHDMHLCGGCGVSLTHLGKDWGTGEVHEGACW